MANIKIDQAFFSKIKYEYADWRWAVAREFLQNSIDAAGTTTIKVSKQAITGEEDSGDAFLVVENDGQPMTKEVLENKLLALGGTTKIVGSGSVGGMGAAKSILYLCHKGYSIRSGTCHVVGSGGEYELQSDMFLYEGTRSIIRMENSEVDSVIRAFKRLGQLSLWSGDLFINDGNGLVKQVTKLRSGYKRRELDFGTVYTNTIHPELLVVRINGLPMFRTSISFNRGVVVELSKPSQEVLTQNRDGLRHPYNGQLAAFITELATNKSSALGRPPVVFRHFSGKRLTVPVDAVKTLDSVPDAYKASANDAVADIAAFAENVPDVTVTLDPSIDGGYRSQGVQMVEGMVSESGDVVRPAAPSIDKADKNPLSNEFVLYNTTGMKVPDCYVPDTGKFSSYSLRLITLWSRAIVNVAKVLKMSGPVTVGFMFDADDVACHQDHSEFGHVYLVNPVRVVSQKRSQSRSFENRWKLSDLDGLLMTAAHELVHTTLPCHDEAYAAQLTAAAAAVLKNRSALISALRRP